MLWSSYADARMGRALRAQPAGTTFHITSRGVRQQALFADRLDFVRFLEIVAHAVLKYDWTCLAYCLMMNHFHLVIRVERETLSAGMHIVNGVYARRFNERHLLAGHVFDSRFAAQQLVDEAHLLETLRYVPLNPVRAGSCPDPSDWEWSSFRATAGIVRPPAFLSVGEVLELFAGSTHRQRQARYCDFVREGAKG